MKITIPTSSVTVNEFSDYVNNCPCMFTKEYMMKKIRKKREALINEVLDSFEEDRITRQSIEFVDTDDIVINIDFAIPTNCVLIKREE